jgi:hypothetical protein
MVQCNINTALQNPGMTQPTGLPEVGPYRFNLQESLENLPLPAARGAISARREGGS